MTMMRVKEVEKNVNKNWVVKKKFKLENYKNCLKATQLENKIIHLNNNKIDVKRIISSRKEFITNKKVILKSWQKYKSEKHNVFTEEISKNGLSSNDDKRIQSTDSLETYCMRNKKKSVI